MSHHISIFVEWFGMSCCIAESQATRRQPALWLHQSTLLPSADRSLTSSIAPRDLIDPISSKSHLLSSSLSQDEALFNTFHTLMFRDNLADRKNFSLTCHFPPANLTFKGNMLGVLNFHLASWYPAHLADVRECKHPLQFGARHLSPHGQKRRLGICKVSRYQLSHWMPLGKRYYSISLHPCILCKKMSTVLSLGTMKHDKSIQIISSHLYAFVGFYSHLQRILVQHNMFLWHAWGLHLLMAIPPAGHMGTSGLI